MGRDGETIAHYYCILMAEDLPAKAFQEDYRALLHLLEALDGFVLVYVFAESTLARNEVRARLSDSLRLRAIGLDVAADADGEALLAKLWRGIEPTAAGKVPLWVECDLPGEDWDRVRGFMLGRLNEARHRLETAFSRPLFLLLPATWKHAAAQAAPDLWSVRKWVLEAPNAIIETTQRIPPRTRDDTRVSHVDSNVSPRLAEMLREWRNMLNSTPAEIGSLVPGWLLVDELIENDGVAALDIAAQVRALAQRRVEAAADPSLRRSFLRDWSVSWNKVGDATNALGRVEEALAAYRESKALCERIVKEFGENREALRDWSISWEKVGDAAKALGRIADALAAYREGKALREREITEYGENPQSIEEVVSMSIKSLDADANSLSQTEHAELRQKILRLARAFPDRPQYHAWGARFGLDTASPLP